MSTESEQRVGHQHSELCRGWSGHLPNVTELASKIAKEGTPVLDAELPDTMRWTEMDQFLAIVWDDGNGYILATVEEQPRVYLAQYGSGERIGEEMARLHDMIGRRILAADGPIEASVLQWRPMHLWQPVLDEMGLVIRDGLIETEGDTFHDGWDHAANQWRPKTCALYRFYDADGVLLYVGISGRMRQRVKEHAAHSSWFEVAARVEIEHLANRKLALDAERAAIKAERPVHNVVHALRPTPLTEPPRRNP